MLGVVRVEVSMPASQIRRYVPVYRDTTDGRAYAVIACGFDDDNHVADWDEFAMGVTVAGGITDLVTDFTMMVSACIRHHPVNYDDLRVGMKSRQRHWTPSLIWCWPTGQSR